MRQVAPPRHRHNGLPVDPRFRRRWAEARRQEGRRRLHALLGLLGLVAVVAALFGLLHSPVMQVRSVQVEGNVHTPRAQVLAAAGLAVRPAPLMINAGSAQARAAVEALPWVASVTFSRHWPWTMVVAVRERAPVAVVAAGAAFAEVDQTGRVLDLTRSLEAPRTLPVVEDALAAPPGHRILPTGGVGQSELGVLLAAAAASPAHLTRRELQLGYSPGLGLVAHLGTTKALILLGDGSDMHTKLLVLQELANTVGLSGYSEVDLTVPQRPALTPGPNSGNG